MNGPSGANSPRRLRPPDRVGGRGSRAGELRLQACGRWAPPIGSARYRLAAEWSLVLLGGAYGCALVARDLRQLAAGEATLQASRLFSARWTFRRPDSIEVARRLVAALAGSLPDEVAASASARIEASARLPVSVVEAQLSAAADHLVTSLDAGQQRVIRARLELEQVRALAEQDQLTGLPNRHFLERFLGGSGGTDDPADLGVLLVDVDNLKRVNDGMGHLAGDAVINAVARTLQHAVRPGDVVVRWGGDEFLVLAPGLAAVNALSVAERLIAAVQRAAPDPRGTPSPCRCPSGSVSPPGPLSRSMLRTARCTR